MNRLVIIGNGFDLAHGLETNYKDFINWYWKYWGRKLLHGLSKVETDGLCTFKIREEKGAGIPNWAAAFQGWYYRRENVLTPWDYNEVVTLAKEDSTFCEFSMSPFLQEICRNIESKGWVDIEDEYYELLKKYSLTNNNADELTDLNKQLNNLKNLLIKYLEDIDKHKVRINESIKEKIYAPIHLDDISVEGSSILKKYVDLWVNQNDTAVKDKIHRYGLDETDFNKANSYFREKYKVGPIRYTDVPWQYLLPDAVLLLSFNYTHTAQMYHNEDLGFIDYIHGKIDDPQSIIFGYGDEMDEKYKELENKNNNQCLENIKSINYLEKSNYRYMLSFIESQPYQICIMGHSCGNSDRTLLNTLFEHKNCISIKPYFYKKEDGTDNYLELIGNISRNFTDMKLMRDRVVNKSFCDPLTQ